MYNIFAIIRYEIKIKIIFLILICNTWYNGIKFLFQAINPEFLWFY